MTIKEILTNPEGLLSFLVWLFFIILLAAWFIFAGTFDLSLPR